MVAEGTSTNEPAPATPDTVLATVPLVVADAVEIAPTRVTACTEMPQPPRKLQAVSLN